MVEFNSGYYQSLSDASAASARVVVPYLMQLFAPASVVDVGCGSGHWLDAFGALGVERLVGLDMGMVPEGDPAVRNGWLRKTDLSVPFAMDERFGLALSIETLQYLPQAREAGFINDLAALAPVVVFSTSIPMQQWPAPGDPIERWQGHWPPLFAKHGFRVCDVVRQKFWDDPRVGWWYRQNVLVFINDRVLLERKELWPLIEGVGRLSAVHPAAIEEKRPWLQAMVAKGAKR
jgi:SAM-dependent methyltransferase